MLNRKILSDVLKIDYLIISNVFNGHSIIDLWYADIKHFGLKGGLLIAAVHTEQSKTGVLWLADAPLKPAPIVSWDKIEIPPGKAVVLDLADWDDPVIPTLHDIDIAPREREMPWCGGGGFPQYSFHIETDFFEADITSDGGKRNPKLIKLVGALVDTVYFFVDKAQNDVISALFENDYGYRRYKYIKYGRPPSVDDNDDEDDNNITLEFW